MVAATSNLAKAKEAMINMLANSATFQTWTGAASAAEAKLFIHGRIIYGPEFQATDTLGLPRVEITRESWENPIAGAGSGTGVPSGTFKLRFFTQHDTDEVTTPLEDQEITFENNVGVVVDELMALSASPAGDYLYLRNPRYPEQSTFSDKTEHDTYKHQVIDVLVDFGLEVEGA